MSAKLRCKFLAKIVYPLQGLNIIYKSVLPLKTKKICINQSFLVDTKFVLFYDML